MKLLTGTSGYSYAEWKGPFYPADLAREEMLAYYARRLGTVEVNNTFYRLPRESVVARWAEEVPDGFLFAIKASQRITHRARLKDAGDSVAYLWNVLQALGPHLGPVLFQLPPNFRQDLPRLRDFLAELPDGLRAAFEFRHESWSNDETIDVLRAGGAALCVAEAEGAPQDASRDAPQDESLGPTEPELPTATDWGYLRLRGVEYTDAALARWAERIRAAPWNEAFVFFKHEEAGAGPRMAQRFAEIFEQGPRTDHP